MTALIYLTTLGKEGIKEVAYQSMQKSHYAYNELIKNGKCKPVFDKPFFKEFVVATDRPAAEVNKTLLDKGIMGGYDLEKDYPQCKNSMLICVTEKRTKEEIDKLASVMGGNK